MPAVSGSLPRRTAAPSAPADPRAAPGRPAGEAEETVHCRPGCGACCIAPSITSPIPGMPQGKRAGERCVQLADDNTCLLFGRPERPAFCGGLRPSAEMCGNTRDDALAWLRVLETATAPGS